MYNDNGETLGTIFIVAIFIVLIGAIILSSVDSNTYRVYSQDNGNSQTMELLK